MIFAFIVSCMLYMSYKYGSSGNGEESFRNGVLANANRGGENVATGAMIGALLGARMWIFKLA